MPSIPRRRALAALAGVVGFAGSAGCSTREPTSTDHREIRTASPSRTTAASPTATPSEETDSPTDGSTPVPLSDDLEFLVVVVRQPTGTAPGRIRASLTNHTDRSLTLSGGDPLPVGYDTIDAERIDASTPLMLFPQQSDAVNQYMNAETSEPLTVADAVRDECWRMPARIIHTAEGMGIELSPKASVVADYFPLGYPDAGCPAGTYEAHGDVSARSSVDGEPVGRIRTTLRVRVAQSGSLSVDGSMHVEDL